MLHASFGQGSGSIVLDDVECDPSIHRTLLQCQHRPLNQHNCHHSEDAGVRCEQIVKSISAANVTTPNCNTVLINMKLQNNNNVTNLFQAVCYNQQHGVYVYISVSNETNNFTTHLRGLFPSSFYTCCISAIYYQQFVARGICTYIKTSELLTTTESSDLFAVSLSSTSNQADSRISNQVESKTMSSISLVGGILGFIIAVLLILSLLSVIALVCLLQPNLKKCVIPKIRYVYIDNI